MRNRTTHWVGRPRLVDWLLTHIFPPWSSTNFRQRVSPSPVPSAFFSAVPTWRNSSNTACWSSGAMPTPVSLTETSTNPSFGTAPTSIRPPSGVNLMAFDKRFRTTYRIFRSSARTSPPSLKESRRRQAWPHHLSAVDELHRCSQHWRGCQLPRAQSQPYPRVHRSSPGLRPRALTIALRIAGGRITNEEVEATRGPTRQPLLPSRNKGNRALRLGMKPLVRRRGDP